MNDNESAINQLLLSNTIKIKLGKQRHKITDIKSACNQFLSYVQKNKLKQKDLKMNGYLYANGNELVGVFGIDGKLWSVEQDVIWEVK